MLVMFVDKTVLQLQGAACHHMASLVMLEVFFLQMLWRLLMRTASIATIAISNDGVIACHCLP
jgi:hypothetical protein